MSECFYKVITSGHIVEVYKFEREAKAPHPHLDKDDGYDALDLENTKIVIEDRVEERRQQTTRDARNLTRRLALMNFNNGDKFITLTFDPKKVENEKDLYSLDYVDAEFKKFIKRFNYKFDTKLKYIAVRETHKSGRLHFHMICDWKYEFTSEDQVKHFERYLGTEVWKHGFVDIKSIDHVDNVGAYLIKYMTKNLAIDLFKGKKVYLCSKGLKRPMEYRGLEAQTIIDYYKLEQKKEVFTNSYESEYLGQIIYKEYNLNRFDNSSISLLS